MRYALISDIHGNYPALEAVLKDSKDKNIDSYIFLGDYPMGLHYPNKVVDTIRDIKNKYIIKGNQEVYLDNLALQDRSQFTQVQFSTLYWTFRKLSTNNINYLRELPKEIIINDYIKINAFHSAIDYFKDTSLSKVYNGNYALTLYENIVNSLDEKLKMNESFNNAMTKLSDSIYVYGHNHTQTHLKVGNKLFINPGSCGAPLDGTGVAPYSILDITNEGFQVSEMRIEYDVDKLIKEFKDSDLYDKAKVFSGITVRQLITGRAELGLFFKIIKSFAQEPYTRDEWEKAYEIWCNEVGEI